MKTRQALEAEHGRLLHDVTAAANKRRLSEAAMRGWQAGPVTTAVAEKVKGEYDAVVSKAKASWRQTVAAHAEDVEFTRGWRMRSIAWHDNKALSGVSPVMASVFERELATMDGETALFTYQNGPEWQKVMVRHLWQMPADNATPADFALADAIAEGPAVVKRPKLGDPDPDHTEPGKMPSASELGAAAAAGAWAVDATKQLDVIGHEAELGQRFDLQQRPAQFTEAELSWEGRRLERVADSMASDMAAVDEGGE